MTGMSNSLLMSRWQISSWPAMPPTTSSPLLRHSATVLIANLPRANSQHLTVYRGCIEVVMYLGSSVKGSKQPTLLKGGHSPPPGSLSVSLVQSSVAKYRAVSRAVTRARAPRWDSHSLTLPSSCPVMTRLGRSPPASSHSPPCIGQSRRDQCCPHPVWPH